MAAAGQAVYWDASAVLSTLFQDIHSPDAVAWLGRSQVHLLSSLARAEILAVIGRLGRDRRVSPVLTSAALTAFDAGPWRSLNDVPATRYLASLAKAWPLRGADLWHLALAKTLHQELPELMMLTYDDRLATAAVGEGLVP